MASGTWLTSWNKLRDHFETEALNGPPVHLCFEAPPRSSEEFVKAFRLCDFWVNPYSQETTSIPRMIAMGMGNIGHYGMPGTVGSFTWFIIHPNVARVTQRIHSMEELDLSLHEAAVVERRFCQLADFAGQLFVEMGQDAPLRPIRQDFITPDRRGWLSILHGLAVDMNARRCPGALRVEALLPKCLPFNCHPELALSIDTIHPEPFAASVGVIELIIKVLEGKRAAEGIPIEYRTRNLTKGESASYHSGGRVANPTKYFERLIEKGAISPPEGSGQQWVFDIRDFPLEVHEKLRRKKL
ncbi:MAG: hypothetical protein WD851_11790 [Pirellulales bacterium]